MLDMYVSKVTVITNEMNAVHEIIFSLFFK